MNAFNLVLIALSGVLMVAMGLVTLVYSRRLNSSTPFCEPRRWTQFACRYKGELKIYPSQAAYLNDPIWSRNVPAVTLARSMYGNIPTSEWRRVYPQDLKALRGED